MSMNRFIAEKVMEVCWHEQNYGLYKICADGKYGNPCRKCGICLSGWDWENPAYTTPADYFALLQFAIGSEWWEDFYRKTWREWHRKQDAWSISRDARHVQWLLAPENFARLVAEYHGWKEEGK